MNEEDCKNQLTEWANQYCPTVKSFTTFECFEYLGKRTLGVTRFYQFKGQPKIKIFLSTKLNKDWKQRAVLWHEFCHAWAYCDLGYSPSHGKEWRKRFWKMPVLAVLDYLIVV